MSQSYLSHPEIAYAVWKSPLGPLGLTARNGTLSGITLKTHPETFPFLVERTYGAPGVEKPEVFETVTRQRTLDRPANTAAIIWPMARALLRGADRPELRVRLVGVTMSKLETVRIDQLALFTDREEAVDSRVTDAVDRLTRRFGKKAVVRATLLPDSDVGRPPDAGPEVT